MARFPYMPFYVDDYRTDTSDLSGEEHGYYFHLIMLAWSRNGEIPNDMKWLKRALSAYIADLRFKRLVPILHRFFTLHQDNIFRQKRIDFELENAKNMSERQRKRAEKRWAPYKKFRELQDATALPRHYQQNRTKNITTSEVVPRDAPPDIDSERGPARGGGFRALQDILSTIPNGPPIK